MSRTRYVEGEYPTKIDAQKVGQRAVGLTYVQKIGSMIKRYEVKKVGKIGDYISSKKPRMNFIMGN